MSMQFNATHALSGGVWVPLERLYDSPLALTDPPPRIARERLLDLGYLRDSERAVLGELLDRERLGGNVPQRSLETTYASLGVYCNYSATTVGRAVQVLQGHGFITVQPVLNRLGSVTAQVFGVNFEAVEHALALHPSPKARHEAYMRKVKAREALAAAQAAPTVQDVEQVEQTAGQEQKRKRRRRRRSRRRNRTRQAGGGSE